MLFAAPPAHEVGLTLEFVGGFGVWGFLGGWGFLGWSGGSVTHVGCGVFHVDVLVSDIHLVLELVGFLTITANTQALQ